MNILKVKDSKDGHSGRTYTFNLKGNSDVLELAALVSGRGKQGLQDQTKTKQGTRMSHAHSFTGGAAADSPSLSITHNIQGGRSHAPQAPVAPAFRLVCAVAICYALNGTARRITARKEELITF